MFSATYRYSIPPNTPLGTADWFLPDLDSYAVLSLEAFALVHVVTWWSGSAEIEFYLSGQLAYLSALALLVGSSGP